MLIFLKYSELTWIVFVDDSEYGLKTGFVPVQGFNHSRARLKTKGIQSAHMKMTP
jgi:hypothetical protein